MADFQTAYLLVADAEGGYQDHPNDTGNYNSLGQLVGTNYGISAPVYEEWIGRPPTRSDMQAITPAIARQIFRVNYWNDIRGDQITSQAVANIFFDGRVNHGRTGTRIMQRVLGVSVDGIVGPVTLGAINAANPAALVENYRQARQDFYHQLVANNPDYGVFLQGWLNRLAQFAGSAGGVASGGILAALLLYFILNRNF